MCAGSEYSFQYLARSSPYSEAPLRRAVLPSPPDFQPFPGSVVGRAAPRCVYSVSARFRAAIRCHSFQIVPPLCECQVQSTVGPENFADRMRTDRTSLRRRGVVVG
ncbi:Hypothetical protein NTJ_15117 [Nesidiocoris tenuis]|uniref:Uncharacterized protein n=1 Tax=Nesidiocoris tenuis TaxID=355587 RepID=A0ABN7BD40_9HEMI|nr:Hypothetical protein NTJ_15117 [Nesidiocoris tenuis]